MSCRPFTVAAATAARVASAAASFAAAAAAAWSAAFCTRLAAGADDRFGGTDAAPSAPLPLPPPPLLWRSALAARFGADGAREGGAAPARPDRAGVAAAPGRALLLRDSARPFVRLGARLLLLAGVVEVCAEEPPRRRALALRPLVDTSPSEADRSGLSALLSKDFRCVDDEDDDADPPGGVGDFYYGKKTER